MLVVHGIDAVRYQGMKPLTLTGSLNSLDGVVSAEGRIIFMTTNFIERYEESSLSFSLANRSSLQSRFRLDPSRSCWRQAIHRSSDFVSSRTHADSFRSRGHSECHRWFPSTSPPADRELFQRVECSSIARLLHAPQRIARWFSSIWIQRKQPIRRRRQQPFLCVPFTPCTSNGTCSCSRIWDWPKGKKDFPHRQQITGNKIVFIGIINLRTELIDNDMLEENECVFEWKIFLSYGDRSVEGDRFIGLDSRQEFNTMRDDISMGNNDFECRSKRMFRPTEVVASQRTPIPFEKKADEKVLFTKISIDGEIVQIDFLHRFQLLIDNHRCFTRSNH